MVPTSHRDQPPSSTVPGRRVDESMTLLTSMMERPLDPGYAAAADRRQSDGLPSSTGLRTPTVLVAAFVVGLLLTLAARGWLCGVGGTAVGLVLRHRRPPTVGGSSCGTLDAPGPGE